MSLTAVTVVLMAGALTMGYVVAGLFFLRFWRKSRDRFFLVFAAAFGLLAVQRAAVTVAGNWSENTLLMYVLRLFAFSLIIGAIIDKNRR